MILQINTPAPDTPEEEVEEFYGEPQGVLSQTPNEDIILMSEPEII